jgi:hypothetical protein
MPHHLRFDGLLNLHFLICLIASERLNVHTLMASSRRPNRTSFALALSALSNVRKDDSCDELRSSEGPSTSTTSLSVAMLCEIRGMTRK